MTWNVLKWVAIAAMLIDHTAAVLGGWLPPLCSGLMRDVGRMAFPIFAYGIAQGCVYTHSARRYLGRLLLFAVLSEIPYRLALRAGSQAFGLFNVFFTLLAGAACCQIVKFCRSKGRRWAWAAVAPVAAIVLLCEVLGTDYGGFGVLCVLLPYLFWESKPARIIALGSVVAFLYVVVSHFQGFSYPLWWMENPSALGGMLRQTLFALAGVGIIALYNGQPGSKKGKWFFYVFYPAHLLALWLLRAAADLTIFYLEGGFS
ncbi:conjugal transfer protein TraX [Acutalibacter sp. LFL-21]|uniref:conjugal transfer protein TraX n=1 Tax=Acutalibacter sp. LFL-21 TaxID=2983399 RepID=UPI0021D65502|nr:conjugal transfer protein TraX [Acutalibacter sp. LFL-21]MCU7652770.1 conjugal transfer protein TraX [Acutalibacter sp. LFL-21]